MDKKNSNLKKPQLTLITWLVTLFIIMLMFQATSTKKEEELSYSQFKSLVKDGGVKSIHMKGNLISGTYSDSSDLLKKDARFHTLLPSPGDDQLMPALEQAGVEITAVADKPGSLTTLIFNFLPWIFIIGFFYYSSKKFSGSLGNLKGGMSSLMPGSKEIIPADHSDITFRDVAGAENSKKDLMEVVDFLKNPGHYLERGAILPKGVLLVGPPGTGKTLMAKAVAGEAGVPFYYISGSEFIEMYVGVGASRVRGLFKAAKKSAPSIFL